MQAKRGLDKNWKFGLLLVSTLAVMSLPALLTAGAMSGTVAGPDWDDHIWALLFVPTLWTMLVAALAMLAAWALGAEKG